MAPGGRLIYVTCSVLPEENEVRLEAVLRTRRDFTLLPAERVWRDTLGRLGAVPPEPTAFAADVLRLTPARHGTDGFFVAVLERAGLEEGEPA